MACIGGPDVCHPVDHGVAVILNHEERGVIESPAVPDIVPVRITQNQVSICLHYEAIYGRALRWTAPTNSRAVEADETLGVQSEDVLTVGGF